MHNGWDDEPEWSVKKWGAVWMIEACLARYGLRYHVWGYITDGGMAPSKTLRELIHGRDLPAIHREFKRALESVEGKPRDAVSAAANILESVFKVYIEDNNMTMPEKQDLQPVFKVVRQELGLDPGSVEHQDLQRIISGLFRRHRRAAHPRQQCS